MCICMITNPLLASEHLPPYPLSGNVLIERCSAFIKLLPDNSDVFFGHNTWDSYQSLGPRIFKKYHFPLWSPSSAADSVLVQYTTLFSSSPALLSSIDDFFVFKGA